MAFSFGFEPPALEALVQVAYTMASSDIYFCIPILPDKLSLEFGSKIPGYRMYSGFGPCIVAGALALNIAAPPPLSPKALN